MDGWVAVSKGITMGCDIHAYEEWKVKGAWHLAKEVEIDRCYELFTHMAGVRQYGDRTNITPIAQDRGLPPDVSVMVALNAESWGADGHSHSWMTWDEVIALDAKWREKFPSSCVFGYLDEGFPAGVTAKRLVFWFDN